MHFLGLTLSFFHSSRVITENKNKKTERDDRNCFLLVVEREVWGKEFFSINVRIIYVGCLMSSEVSGNLF